jgi:hypothetical protein
VASSGVEAEQTIDEGHLGLSADRLDPKLELPLLEHPHHLETLDRRPSRSHGLEAQRRPNQAFELAVDPRGT